MKCFFILGIIATAMDSTGIKFLRKLKFEIWGNLMKMEWYLTRGVDGIRVVATTKPLSMLPPLILFRSSKARVKRRLLRFLRSTFRRGEDAVQQRRRQRAEKPSKTTVFM